MLKIYGETFIDLNIEGPDTHVRSQSASPTPKKENKTKRKKSFKITFRKSSIFSKAGGDEARDAREGGGESVGQTTGNISFLGQIYKNAVNRFSLTRSSSLSSTTSSVSDSAKQ